MRSLRIRLLTGIIVGIILSLAVFSLIVYTVIRSALVAQFDSSLASIAQILAASVERDGGEIELEFEVQQMPEFQNEERPTYYQLWTENGEVLARSPLLRTNDLVRSEGPRNKLVFIQTPEKNEKILRAVSLTFVPRNADNDEADAPPPIQEQLLSMTVARDAGDLFSQLHFLSRLLLISSTVVILLSLLIAGMIVRKGLNPLNTIAAEIATISEDNLTTRITTENVPIELVPIKKRLNELMFRLEASFNKERQFNADVTHELRTPLAGIRSTIEVTLSRNRETTEYQQALTECLYITKMMQSLVSNLLMLASMDARQTSYHVEHMKITEVVNRCWNSCSERASKKKINFHNRTDTEMVFQTDRQNLSILLSNVLDNAVEYTENSGQIWATASRTDDSFEISISNTGCRLTSEQISHVFDCFWRADASRSDAGVHCGLGLALVRKLTKAFGGYVTAELQSGEIFTIRLNLPLKSDEPSR